MRLQPLRLLPTTIPYPLPTSVPHLRSILDLTMTDSNSSTAMEVFTGASNFNISNGNFSSTGRDQFIVQTRGKKRQFSGGLPELSKARRGGLTVSVYRNFRSSPKSSGAISIKVKRSAALVFKREGQHGNGGLSYRDQRNWTVWTEKIHCEGVSWSKYEKLGMEARFFALF
ncbi:hypothetical protein E1B28_000134 [Marasmius oreades]|uniref:Uncharacterized protein n=1 Tax=Marasmius oreades TaxID=181124 RepID=A0A9P7V0V9_9AGAR|nr:uncharacterized protein E1B28_000134 [Marasmius oreades]KAG7098165.1 hypothetical protein E1B28_000134 [Marasmius oreades]